MQTISFAEIHKIARGSAVLASGGGGDPFRGELSVSAALERTGPVQLIGLDELPDDAFIASVFLIGAPVALLEKFPFCDELVRAMRELERLKGRSVDAVFSVEAGGVNSMVPFSVAAIAGIPVIDADTMGRAFPEMDLTLINLAGVSSAPVVITDDYGTLISIDSADNVVLEKLSRAISFRSGAAVAAAGFSGTVSELRPGLSQGSISLAAELGQVMDLPDREPEDTWQEIVNIGRGRKLFDGKVVSAHQDVEQGWGVGTVQIEGSGKHRGTSMRVDVVNEYLAATVDGTPVASTPDIISIYDATSGTPLTSEGVRYGRRVGVIALPCDARWASPQGLALAGPRRFGYAFDYVDFRTGGGHAQL